MGGFNPFKSVSKVVGSIFSGVTKIVSKAISWLIPVPEVPDFDIPQSEQSQGILLNKSSCLLYTSPSPRDS